MANLNPGDKIAFTASFLKNTGQFTGTSGARRGVYVKADRMPGFARVRWGDEETRIAEGVGNYAEADYCADIREHGSLVCEKNICRVGSDKFACNDI